ncbi:hypothetical protein B5X24_HaOG213673 [Helicoverpa armigera]|uniref:Uncharacterized protein n=1 Tax=Helicoverpa armigera TaxID=29058 RepID=A0A2W1B4Q5_HELAM|nr:hypothetical protein B5X24_HaOG213673 [Helicoverpa armigera]
MVEKDLIKITKSIYEGSFAHLMQLELSRPDFPLSEYPVRRPTSAVQHAWLLRGVPGSRAWSPSPGLQRSKVEDELPPVEDADVRVRILSTRGVAPARGTRRHLSALRRGASGATNT